MMHKVEILDELIGAELPYDKILSSISNFEFGELNRLARMHGWSDASDIYKETAKGLYRFKQVLRLYANVWKKTFEFREFTPQEMELGRIFSPIYVHLDLPSRRCFSHNQFFGKLHFLLHACSALSVSAERQAMYVKMVLNFPVIPVESFEEIIEHEIYPANLPHTFMDMAAGLIRVELERKRTHKQVMWIYKTFLRERHVHAAHTRWFDRRLPGSACSKQ